MPPLTRTPDRRTRSALSARRTMHVGLAVVALGLLAPVAALVAIAIRLDSPGSVVFRQTRVGRAGRTFEMFKFRTMYDHREEVAVFTTIGDERVTRVGSSLRRARLDEIPQLINVIRGDMNLVGPRPERPEFVEQFCATVADYDRRHEVLPGITGLAQLELGYAASAEAKLELDLAYISQASLKLDLSVLWKTATSVGSLNDEGVDPSDPRARGKVTH